MVVGPDVDVHMTDVLLIIKRGLQIRASWVLSDGGVLTGGIPGR